MALGLHSRLELAHATDNRAAGGTLAIVSAGTTLQVTNLYRMILFVGGATTITVQDTASSALSAPYNFAAAGFLVLDISINGDPWWEAAAGKGLQLNSSNAVQVSADIWYLQEP